MNKAEIINLSSAGRLKYAIDQLRKHPNKPLMMAWSLAFDMSIIRRSRMLDSIVAFSNLPAQIKSDVVSIELSPEDYTPWESRITAALAHNNFERDCKTILSHFDDNVYSLIKICDDQLARAGKGESCRDADIVELIDLCQSVIDAAGQDGVPVELRFVVSSNMLTLIDTLHDVRIHGADVLKSGLERVSGSIVLNSDILIPEKDSLVVEQMWKVLQRYSALYSTISSVPELASVVSLLLG